MIRTNLKKYSVFIFENQMIKIEAKFSTHKKLIRRKIKKITKSTQGSIANASLTAKFFGIISNI